jgi:hypothetical protein
MRIVSAYLFLCIGERLEVCVEIGRKTFSIWLQLVPSVHANVPKTGYESDIRAMKETHLRVFFCLGSAYADTFCLLGTADGDLLSAFLFPLRASLALSRCKFLWPAIGGGAALCASELGVLVALLGIGGTIIALLGLMVTALLALADKDDPGELGSWRVNLNLSHPGVAPVVLDGAVVVVLVDNGALAGAEAVCNHVNNTS